MNAKALDLDLDQASNNGSFKVVLRGGQADRMDHLHQQTLLCSARLQTRTNEMTPARDPKQALNPKH